MKGKPQNLPDAQVRHAVIRQLEWEPEVTSTEIGASVTNGVVTLSGQVDSYAEKLAAERTVKRVHGVKAIANDLQVRPLGARTDTEIAADALRAIEVHVRVPPDKIKVTVRDGWIRLEGRVEWIFQKEAAESAVEYLGGVRGIANEIRVAPKLSPPNVREMIEEALGRTAGIETDRVEVEARNGVVTLSGVVNSWMEKEEVERVAQAAPGVTRVESNLVVAPEYVFWE
jgi:osmotically-inducible protein OsmY